MQRKIIIKQKDTKYIIKVDDELTLQEVIENSMVIFGSLNEKQAFYIPTKERYIQKWNKLKNLNIVDNDIIEVLEKNEDTI